MSERYLQENVHLGDRFLFLQGGPSSFADASTLRIAYITPELEGWQRDKQGHCYIHWNSKWDILTNRPLKYEYQFDILDHPGDSEFSDHERQILGILNPKILGDNRNSKAGRSTWYLRNKNIRIDLSSGQAQILLKLYTDYVNGRSPIDFITANDESYP